ncbi:MAG: mechanosensitive ion channel [Lewinellaceae bacterium]|nr:mechanosensitive ion channel [Phaeodactylibacter sp.]MCB0616890.1 mechanosensitive ion channel [Phaeodactylibacter sp.]MCB9347639.1 mechanosensitive ion channel [Lewinellaceae bacterium]
MIIPLQFDLMAILQDLLSGFVAVVPNLLGALAVFIIGLVVSKVAARFVRRILMTIGADKLAERLNEIEIVYKSNIQLVPSTLLSKVVYYFLLFIFVIAATDILNMPVISQLMGEILNYIPVLISALAVFVIGLLISDFLKNVVKTTCDSLGIPASGMISSVVFYFLFLNITMIALSQARIDTEFIQDNISILLAGVVLAFAIGYGFASRNIVANFLASFYNKGKINVGDTIGIEGVKGRVRSMDSSSIVLEVEGREVLIPLSKIASEKIDVFERAQPETEGD